MPASSFVFTSLKCEACNS